MKTPITYYGGKQSLVSEILPRIPVHTTYCEPFFGGGAIFFQKPKSDVEIINDLNRYVVNFYLQAKTNFVKLQKRIQQTPHSRSLHKDAQIMYQNPHLFSDIDLAWAFWILCNQGFTGKIGTWAYGTISNACEKKNKNQRINFTDTLADRLDLIQIECTDALHLLQLRDRPTTFFYLDPPYFNSNMGHYGGYTEQDFENLLKVCQGIQGKFLLSSYPSEILSKYTKENGWYQVEIEKIVSASSSRKKKTEVLTANYPI